MMVHDGLTADFVVCGEPTDMRVGVQAKGVLMLRIDVPGTAAHGATPWLGDNAVLRAVDLYRRISGLPVRLRVGPALRAPVDQPRAHPGRRRGEQGPRRLPHGRRPALPARPVARGGAAPGALPRPAGDPRGAAGAAARRRLARARLRAGPAGRRRAATSPRRPRSAATAHPTRSPSSRSGVPAVEFGPRGAGHHGPDEYVEIESLPRYRRALAEFARMRRGVPAPAPPPIRRSPPRERRRPSPATEPPATGASPRRRRMWCRSSAGRCGDRRLVVSVAAGGYIYLDDTLQAAAPNTPEAKAARAATKPVLPGEPTNVLLIGSDTRPSRRRPRAQRLADPGADGPAARTSSRCSRSRATSTCRSPGGAHGQDQRGLLARARPRRSRPSSSSPGRTDQRLHDRQLHRVRQPRGRGGRRVPRHRPPVLQQEHRHDRDQLRRASTWQPGYQKLDGANALDYVRYRHTDSTYTATPASRTSCPS